MCGEYTITLINQNQNYSDLVTNIAINSDLVNDMQLVNDNTPNYSTILTITTSGANNTGIPNVPIDLSIETGFGTIAPSTCTTDELGNCEVTLNTTSDNLGESTIQACASLSTDLCGNYTINFIPFIES